MSTPNAQSQWQPRSLLNLRDVNRYFWSVNRPVTIIFWFVVMTSVLGFIGMALDVRTVLGLPTQAKTTKFSLSIALYAATMLWLFSYDRLRLRLSRFILSASAYTLGFEMVLIMLEGARGAHAFQQCHALGSTLFQLMAVTITFF